MAFFSLSTSKQTEPWFGADPFGQIISSLVHRLYLFDHGDPYPYAIICILCRIYALCSVALSLGNSRGWDKILEQRIPALIGRGWSPSHISYHSEVEASVSPVSPVGRTAANRLPDDPAASPVIGPAASSSHLYCSWLGGERPSACSGWTPRDRKGPCKSPKDSNRDCLYSLFFFFSPLQRPDSN